MSISEPGIGQPALPFKIGIAMAVYQPDPAFLEQQLRSIREQTYRDWVCVMTWDTQMASFRADGRFAPFISDVRFLWVQNANRLGCVKNFEKAVRLACGQSAQAIAFADQDDVWQPGKLEIQAQALRNARPLSLVHCDLNIIANEHASPGTVWELEKRGVHNAKPLHLFIRNVVSGCAALFDADLARLYPVIPPEADYHDHWYAIAASTHGGVIAIRQPLIAYRQHSSNVLGVSRYPGFAMLLVRAPWQYLKKAGQIWVKSKALVRAAMRAGMKIPLSQRLLFLTPFDLGIGMFALGLRHLWDDPGLARQSFSLGIGKIPGIFISRTPDR